MAAYVVGTLFEVNDPERFGEYASVASSTVEKYGGKFVMRGQNIEVGDGSWAPISMLVIEFESMARAKEWYNSPEYTAIKAGRTEATNSGLIFAEGR